MKLSAAVLAGWMVSSAWTTEALSPALRTAMVPALDIPAGHLVVGHEIWEGRRRLLGAVRVASGARLTLAPGTIVEAATTSGVIVIDRDARLDADGPGLDPVVMGCADGGTSRGWWAGVVINGDAPLASGTPTSPAVRGTGASGCFEMVADGLTGAFGGCDAADSSGVLRFVRIEHASRGLELNGVGNRTVVSHVQVHGSATHGLTIRGGTVGLWRVLVTAPGGPGMTWRDGWIGIAQSIGVQRIATDTAALVDGLGAAAGAGPTFHNISLFGTGTGPAIRFTGGGHFVLGNGLIAGMASALDLDGAPACAAAAAGALRVFETTLLAVAREDDADPDVECPTAERDVLDRPGDHLQVMSSASGPGAVVAGFATTLPDFRPRTGGGIAPGVAPVGFSWFEPSSAAEQRGMTPATNAPGGASIPWFSGWTVDGAPGSVPFGTVTGMLASSAGAAIGGALIRVEQADAPGVSAANGSYTVGLARPGTRAVTVENLPAGCSVGPTTVSVSANATTIADLVATCAPAPIQPTAIRLTYICGTTFRVRNGNLAPVIVTWDVAGTAERGTLQVPARAYSALFSEVFFTTVATGTVRLFFNGAQVDVKANGGFVCP